MLLRFAVPVLRSRAAGGPEAGPGLAEHFEHRIRPLAAGLAVPAFAFFAAGVALGIVAGLVRLWPSRAAASGALLVAAAGAAARSATLLVLAVVVVTGTFGLGQPALMDEVGESVPEDVRGVALGVATLMFLVGGGVGSAVAGGFGEVIGMAWSLRPLAALPVLGVLALIGSHRERAAS